MVFKSKFKFRSCVYLIITSFLTVSFVTDLVKVKASYASDMVIAIPGQMIALSGTYSLPSLKGIKFDPANPFDLQMIIDQGSDKQVSEEQKSKLFRFFLAGLTVPEDKLWVNLSPYESERVIEDVLANTEVGETLLEQDYILKQLSSSLTHPDTELGKNYWNSLDQDNDSFNKIWISPKEISIYDDANSVLVANIELDVQTQEDYLASQSNNSGDKSTNSVKNVIIPALKKDVNQGRNFSQLRQMIDSLVLAQCFKKKFANSLYSFYYNSEKIDGLNIADPKTKEKVFERYVKAFNQGAYNLTKKVRDHNTGRIIKKAYFSGGASASVKNTSNKKIDLALIEQNEFLVQDLSLKMNSSALNQKNLTIVGVAAAVTATAVAGTVKLIKSKREKKERERVAKLKSQRRPRIRYVYSSDYALTDWLIDSAADAIDNFLSSSIEASKAEVFEAIQNDDYESYFTGLSKLYADFETNLFLNESNHIMVDNQEQDVLVLKAFYDIFLANKDFFLEFVMNVELSEQYQEFEVEPARVFRYNEYAKAIESFGDEWDQIFTINMPLGRILLGIYFYNNINEFNNARSLVYEAALTINDETITKITDELFDILIKSFVTEDSEQSLSLRRAALAGLAYINQKTYKGQDCIDLILDNLESSINRKGLWSEAKIAENDLYQAVIKFAEGDFGVSIDNSTINGLLIKLQSKSKDVLKTLEVNLRWRDIGSSAVEEKYTRDGGIDLKSMTSGIYVSESSSAIRVSPEQAANITGISFNLLGEAKLLPIKQIFAKPSI